MGPWTSDIKQPCTGGRHSGGGNRGSGSQGSLLWGTLYGDYGHHSLANCRSCNSVCSGPASDENFCQGKTEYCKLDLRKTPAGLVYIFLTNPWCKRRPEDNGSDCTHTSDSRGNNQVFHPAVCHHHGGNCNEPWYLLWRVEDSKDHGDQDYRAQTIPGIFSRDRLCNHNCHTCLGGNSGEHHACHIGRDNG